MSWVYRISGKNHRYPDTVKFLAVFTKFSPGKVGAPYPGFAPGKKKHQQWPPGWQNYSFRFGNHTVNLYMPLESWVGRYKTRPIFFQKYPSNKIKALPFLWAKSLQLKVFPTFFELNINQIWNNHLTWIHSLTKLPPASAERKFSHILESRSK